MKHFIKLTLATLLACSNLSAMDLNNLPADLIGNICEFSSLEDVGRNFACLNNHWHDAVHGDEGYLARTWGLPLEVKITQKKLENEVFRIWLQKIKHPLKVTVEKKCIYKNREIERLCNLLKSLNIIELSFFFSNQIKISGQNFDRYFIIQNLQNLTQSLEKMKHLKKLDLQLLTFITGKELKNLVKLEVLNLESTFVTTQNLENLTKLSALREINLSFCTKIDAQIISILPVNLKNLNLEYIHTLIPEGLEKFTSLEKLYLTYTDVANEEVAKLPRTLKQLSLSSCKFITEKGFKSLARLTNLEALNLTDTKISFETLIFLVQNLKRLRICAVGFHLDQGSLDERKKSDALIGFVEKNGIETKFE